MISKTYEDEFQNEDIKSFLNIKEPYNIYSKIGKSYKKVFKIEKLPDKFNNKKIISSYKQVDQFKALYDNKSNNLNLNECLYLLYSFNKYKRNNNNSLYNLVEKTLIENDNLNKENYLKRNKIIHKDFNTLKDSLKNIKKINKIFEIKESIIQNKKIKYNKVMSFCSYRPNYDVISKHIPCPIIREEVNKKNINNNVNLKNLKPINNNNSQHNSYSTPKIHNINNKNNKNLQLSNKSKDYSKNKILTVKIQPHTDIRKEIINIKNKNKLTPTIHLKRYISAPDFNKMSSRNKLNIYKKDNLNGIIYFPNYNYLYSKNYSPFSDNYKKKLYKLRKISASQAYDARYNIITKLNNY